MIAAARTELGPMPPKMAASACPDLYFADYCLGVRMLSGGTSSKSLRNGLMSMPPRRVKRA